MDKMSTADYVMLFLRIHLFLLGCIFTAIGRIIAGQFKLGNKMSRIQGKCDARHNYTKTKEEEQAES
jgi:hypothetical protein